MIKRNLSKYFKIAVFIMAIVFFTVQAVQAQAIDPAQPDDLTVTDDDGQEQRILDGDTTNDDGGDTLLIEAGGEILTTADDEHGVLMINDDNEVTVEGKITTEGDADGINSTGDNAKITIEETGEIVSEEDGIDAEGEDTIITHSGTITAGEDGIYVETDEDTDLDEEAEDSGNAVITNTGTINAVENGILVDGHNAKVYNSGTINAEEDDGIYVQGNNAEIINEAGGVITAGEDGIEVLGNNAKITNDGSITAIWDGIIVDGDGNSITNRGTIDAGFDAEGNEIADGDGIIVEGDGNTIINDVDATITAVEEGIEVEGEGNTIINEVGATIIAGDEGIHVETEEGLDIEDHAEDSGNNIVTNKGKIEAVGDGMYIKGNNAKITNAAGATIIAGDDGIYLKGNNAEIINEAGGAITAGDDGIDVLGNNAKITNRGTINAEDHGIDVEGDGNTIINDVDATITAGNDGIKSEGDNVEITNNGSISVESEGEDGVAGIYSYNNKEDGNSLITNNGKISVKSEKAMGIYSWSKNSIVINNGVISIEGGVEGIGIYSVSNNGNISNHGKIHIAGSNGIGIWSDSTEGETKTISNYGSIYVDDPRGYAILGETGKEIVNLFSGSDTFGDINLGGGDDIINYYIGAKTKSRIDLAEGDDTANVHGNGRPTVANTLTFHGAEAINFHGIIGVRNGDIATTIDPSIQSVKSSVLSSFTSGLHNVITDRLDTELKNKSYFWADSFNSYRERGSEDLVFGYDHQYNGITFGYDVSDDNLRFGIMAGYSIAKTDGEFNAFETESDSLFGGIYGQFNLGKLRIATSLLGGYEDHEDERAVFDNEKGYQTAQADYNSWFFSPSVKLSRSFNLTEQLFLEPSATAAYSIGWYDSYDENGTVNSNLSMNDRTIDAFNGNLQLKSFYRYSNKFEFGVYGGLTARYTDDEIIDGNFGSTAFSYSARNDDSVYGELFGAYVDYALKDNFDLNFKVEHGEMDGDEKRDFVTGGFQIKF